MKYDYIPAVTAAFAELLEYLLNRCHEGFTPDLSQRIGAVERALVGAGETVPSPMALQAFSAIQCIHFSMFVQSISSLPDAELPPVVHAELARLTEALQATRRVWYFPRAKEN